MREPFLSDTTDHGRLVVHGHTALNYPHLYPNRLNVDGGAGFGNMLVPVVLEEGEVFALTDFGRASLGRFGQDR